MDPAPRLNTTQAHTWAAVVSGTAWKTHSLKSSGLLTAEYKHGPLILWASRLGEEEAVQPSGPAVSAIEEQVDRLNTAQVFERFKSAARGKVRPSVRWKSSRKLRSRHVALWFLFQGGPLRLEWALANGKIDSTMIDMKEALSDPSFIIWESLSMRIVRKAVSRRFFKKIIESEKEERRIKARKKWVTHILETKWKKLDKDGIEASDARTSRCVEAARRGHLPKREDVVMLMEESGSPFPLSIAKYFDPENIGGTYSTYLAVWRFLRRMTDGAVLKNSIFLKRLEAAAYRAHLTRRVKPAPRRHRIRRPLHSRPRPPSAPLAPPVS